MEKTKNTKSSVYNKTVEIPVKLSVKDLIGYLLNSELPFEKILTQLMIHYYYEGSGALTGLPIVTNKNSCTALENFMICQYVLSHKEEILKKGMKYFAEKQKEQKNE